MDNTKNPANAEAIKALKSASFHLLLAPNPQTPSRLELSAIYVRSIGYDVVIFDRVTDASSQIEVRVALPLEEIRDVLPLPLVELERQVGKQLKRPDNDGGHRLEGLQDYFARAVAPFLLAQGVETLWKQNKEQEPKA